MSEYVQFAQIAQDKWATVSEPFRLLIRSFVYKKQAIGSKKFD